MASQTYEPHFVFIPLMGPGHIIPIIDIARLLAQRGVTVTIATTPQNAARFASVVNRATSSGLPIRFLQLEFPLEAGLPKGCENVDSMPSMDMLGNFVTAISMLQQPFEKSLMEMRPPPSCIVSDKFISWAASTASQFRIPRILFDGMSCFTLLCNYNLHKSEIYKHVTETEPFVVPGLPHRIEFTRAQLSGYFNPGSNKKLNAMRQQVRDAEEGAYGVLVNSFEELEPEYLRAYREATGDKVWCIGPVSLCNKEISDKAERGNKTCIDENKCLKWLDSRSSNSVLYVCFGSINRLTPPQLIELGLALEASNRSFIWVIRQASKPEEMEKWLTEYGFEERVKGRGLLIKGWAPQVLILSHQAIGGFLTHCGWNSTLEGICAGVPMATWPLFGEQFYNEKLIVQVLEIGVRVGSPVVTQLGDEEKFGVLVKEEDVTKAIEKLMDEGEEGKKRRERAQKFAAMAVKAVEKGGSSYLNITLLIQDINRVQANQNQP
ncbi:hypothetical protein SLEP1_g48461 [Rubroshorea leprosula]|uniref:Glycosyltransferase n=1 Tax=Rubroshorea leprosula TaxID=152421 RepID=A0AAV5LVS6_9ROSI|nr:hypothetical protein SLEP1_g48461 [Rubroshorea leprosula]